MIHESADELYDFIENEKFCEDEQYCRAALVLLNVYLDRHHAPHKVKILKRKLIEIINKHLYSPVFLEFNACFNRKSALYYAAVIARNQIEQSIHFYREYNNPNGLYMALCNHAANAIISGAYIVANESLSECQDIITRGERWNYPSQYKFENNKILLTYLQEEKLALNNRRKLLSVVKRTVKSLAKIIALQKDEVSHVIFLNYLGLSILCDSKTWETELIEAEHILSDTDTFYQYYFHDLKYAVALLHNNLKVAEEEINILSKLDVPLLYPYKIIFDKRRHIQKCLLTCPDRVAGDAITYHRIIIDACVHIQDPSCYFYGRGFLLSDLQFLSF